MTCWPATELEEELLELDATLLEFRELEAKLLDELMELDAILLDELRELEAKLLDELLELDARLLELRELETTT